MANTVFILGAGASKEAGGPLMDEFLDVSHDIWKLGKAEEVDSSYKLVFRARAALQSVHSKSQLDFNNIESVFGALEMAKTLKKFPGLSPDEIDPSIKAIKTLIAHTLEQTIRFTVLRYTDKPPRIQSPRPYGTFVDLLKKLKQTVQPAQGSAILTFNYDIAIDHALYMYGPGCNYGFGKSNEGIPLLKLHGSLNWAEALDQAVVPRPINEIAASVESWLKNELELSSQFRPTSEDELRFVTVPVKNFLKSKSSENVTAEPVLVPPTWNKTDSHRSLSTVWSRAAAELSEAENIIVMGYSMPHSDAFFRYLYALGTVGNATLRRFWVFNPDTSGEVKSRFQALLGPGAQFRFQYFEETFSSAIEILRNEFLKAR
jgi:hypothetical protein